jgi:PAS domain S-box-containing protein
MNNSKTISDALSRLSVFGASLACAIGLIVMLGWIFDLPQLTRLIPEGNPSRPKTALSLIFTGAALLLLGRAGRVRQLGRVLALMPGLIGGFVIVENLLGRNFKVDQWIYTLATGVQATPYHLSMSPISAAGFLCLTIALLLLDVRTRGNQSPAQWLSLVPLWLSLMGVLGYAYGAEMLYQAGHPIALALPSAIGLLVVSAATMLARPDRLPIALLATANNGGFLARRLIPAALIFPIAAGMVRMAGQRAGLYDTELGLALFTLMNILFFSILIGWVAWQLAGTDMKRLQTEENLRLSEERFRLLLNSVAEGIYGLDTRGNCTFVNQACLRLLGYSDPRELVGRNMHDLIHHTKPDGTPFPQEDCQIFHAFRRQEPVHLSDDQLWRKDGTPFPAEYWSFPVFQHGDVVGAVVSFFDITQRKRAVEALRRSEQLHRELAQTLEGERNKLTAIFESLPVGLGIGDTRGATLSMNQAGLRLHGFASEREMFKHLEEYRPLFELRYLDGRVMPVEEWPISRAMRGDFVHDYELRLANKRSGLERVVSYSVVPVRNKEGEPTLIVYVMQDLTERKRAEEALREAKEQAERSRAEQQAILTSMAEAVVIFDPRGHLLDINPAGLALHGFHSVEQMRHHLSELDPLFRIHDLQGNHLPIEQWPISRVLRGESFSPFEVHVARTDGSKSFIGSYGGAPVLDPEGRLILAVVTIRDVTQQREAEQALAQAKAQIERHARELENIVAERTAELRETVGELEAFSYSLSHDMRAPLRAMKGFSQILQAEFGTQLGSEGSGYLRRIAAAAGRLDQLIRDVLTYSRIIRERIELQPIDLDNLTRQLIEENPALQAPRAAIEIESPLHRVLGHEAYLMQVISNLVYNAVKFVTPGQQPRVRVWTQSERSEVRLFVQDNGIGIPKEAQERMFRMFERFHNNQAYEGTGIGLTIVRKAVERMGGRVGVDSEPGKGSTFWVELPVAEEGH